MPNGIDWKKITGDTKHPIETMKPVLDGFAVKNDLKFHYSTYHDGLYVEFKKENKSIDGEYYIAKRIRIGLISLQEKLACSISVYVNTHYGLKELILFVPILRTLRNKWHRYKWSQRIGYLDFPIDLEKLRSLLSQAKQILDNFDESLLQEVK